MRFDLKRKGRGVKLSNEDWTSTTDPEARIAKMKVNSMHHAYKLEHAADLDTGVILAVLIHGADEGETETRDPRSGKREQPPAVGVAPTWSNPAILSPATLSLTLSSERAGRRPWGRAISGQRRLTIALATRRVRRSTETATA